MIPQDYHMHSNFSGDCEAPMAAMCRSATARNIGEIGFTEHYDLHFNEPLRDWFRPEPWWEELTRCRREFAGQLTIRAGIEIGEPHRFAVEAQAMISAVPFDYVLGSLHWVGDESIFDRRYFETRSPDEAFEEFFVELEVMTRGGGFDVLSHFDVPVRVGHTVYGDYDPRRYEALIRSVLQNCIDQGIALDLNTAALRRPANILTPSLPILRWYAEMGGERITLGADAHRPQHVGLHLDIALEAARAAGLTSLTYYEQRQPRQIAFVGD